MNRLFTRLYPSPSIVVSITALVVALGSAGYSATGGNFILGQTNSASTQTKLVAPIAGPALGVDNSNTGAGATGLRIVTAATRPPLVVNSSTRVDNLNADKLDGLNSTQFPRKAVIPFNLAPGATTGQISLPGNQPVFVMGVTTTNGERSVGQATLLRVPGGLIMWTGLESLAYFASSPNTSGYGSATGAHIVFLDYSHVVYFEVSGPDAIRIHNEGGFARAGVVTLMW
jgi:hypothetical protein